MPKQARSSDIVSDATTPARQSARIKSSPMVGKTPQKSPYFEASDGEPSSEAEVSGYEDEDVSAEPSAEENMDDEVASEDERPESRRKRRKVNQKVVERVIKEEDEKGKELWRPDVAVDAEAGEAVFISLPKARSAGKTPYTPDTIHPNTLAFLGDLRRNNDREWLKMHDADYRQSKRDFDEFVDAVTPKLAEKDETIPELPHKDLTFRIYRDIRFSPDPTPYKTHFSAAWSRTGRKGPYAGYYVQVKPGASFLGAGLWCPEAAPLALLRAAVDRKSHRLKEVLMNERIRHEFMNGVRAKESECVKKFIAMNQENALKRKPKDYDIDNPNIGLLRLRNYTLGRKLADAEVIGKDRISRLVDLMGVLEPFVTYLNSVVMPDDDEAESSEAEQQSSANESDEPE